MLRAPQALTDHIVSAAHVIGQGHEADSANNANSADGGASSIDIDDIEKKAAFGILCWQVALEHGLVPDDKTLRHLQKVEKLAFLQGRDLDDPGLRWPMEPLRSILIKEVSVLGIAPLAAKYPVIQETLLKGILTTVFEFAKHVYKVEDFVEEREKDEDGNFYENTEEIAQRQEEAESKYRNPNMTPEQVAIARKKKMAEMKMKQEASLMDDEDDEELASLTPDERKAKELVKRLVVGWQKPIDAMKKAGKAFSGFEELLASGSFALDGNIWNRKGWEKMDELREKLENIRELRDLVRYVGVLAGWWCARVLVCSLAHSLVVLLGRRSLGRGGGWGPLRRAPVQHLDMNARMGLLRTVRLRMIRTTNDDDRSCRFPSLCLPPPADARPTRPYATTDFGGARDEGTDEERRHLETAAERGRDAGARDDGAHVQADFLRKAGGEELADVRARRMGRVPDADRYRPAGDPPDGGQGTDPAVRRHVGVDARAQGTGGQGTDARVHACGEDPGARVLRVCVCRAKGSEGARAGHGPRVDRAPAVLP